ncbi:MAG: tRNA (guanosine(46)-N7)-methyltransferase TrmB [Lachnospiraceae bacterium]|jgi:tRNA (guanine-N7-)-methyltransferase|nr:tRNA (guanosine(46)-N7)-methyltransferase TrmB [Lachnospiraceae bacterium]
MRLRNITGSEELIKASRYFIEEPSDCLGKWQGFFANTNPVHIEIGMGKGQFITEMARNNPAVNFIGIERYPSVLYRAVTKLDLVNPPLENLAIICLDVRDISTIFAASEVERIYTNFPDPWHKKRHTRRRITSQGFLSLYENILIDGGMLEMKTDDEQLFRYSMAEMALSGWHITYESHDLHRDETLSVGNVMSEYEEKFKSRGQRIMKISVRCPQAR